MSLYRRVFSGTVANTVGIGLTSLLQIATVPILASSWGAERFGVWMMLTTIPTYFALTDLGFLQAATSEMTMRHAVGNNKGTLTTFQSTSILIAFVCLGVSLTIWAIGEILALSGVALAVSYHSIIALLGVLAALSLTSRLSVAALRATGHYAVATMTFDTLSVLEGFSGLLVAYLGGGFESVVLIQLGVRLLNIAAIYLMLRRKAPFLYVGTDCASRAEIKRLLGPAVGAMTIPVALAINLQGVVLIIGWLLGPIAVALYTPVRTCSRLIIQTISVVNRATMPELSAAASRSHADDMSRILRINVLTVLILLVPGAILFGAFGKEFVTFWSAGRLAPDRVFVILMAAASFIQGLWYFASNLLLATNSHIAIAKFILTAAIVSVALTFALCSLMGLNGAAIALTIGEAICAIAVGKSFFTKYRAIL